MVAAKMVATNLFKMIPDVGTVVGGVISSATAAVMTMALGEAYIGVMTALFKGEIKSKNLEPGNGKEHLKRIFEEILRKEAKKKADTI